MCFSPARSDRTAHCDARAGRREKSQSRMAGRLSRARDGGSTFMASNVQRGSLMKLRTAFAVALGILLLGIPYGSSAQTPNADLDVGDGSGLPGDTGISVAVSLASHDGALVSGANFDLGYDSSRLSVSGVNTGEAAAAANKDATSLVLSDNPLHVIVAGLNANVIGDGVIAYVIFDVLPGAASGTFDLTLSNVALTDPGGVGVASNPSNG